MKHGQIYLRFYCETTESDTFVPVSDLLDSGVPIDVETGNDLELKDDLVYVKNGNKFIPLDK